MLAAAPSRPSLALCSSKATQARGPRPPRRRTMSAAGETRRCAPVPGMCQQSPEMRKRAVERKCDAGNSADATSPRFLKQVGSLVALEDYVRNPSLERALAESARSWVEDREGWLMGLQVPLHRHDGADSNGPCILACGLD